MKRTQSIECAVPQNRREYSALFALGFLISMAQPSWATPVCPLGSAYRISAIEERLAQIETQQLNLAPAIAQCDARLRELEAASRDGDAAAVGTSGVNLQNLRNSCRPHQLAHRQLLDEQSRLRSEIAAIRVQCATPKSNAAPPRSGVPATSAPATSGAQTTSAGGPTAEPATATHAE